MSIYLVDIHHVTHTCPADPTPHAIDTRRRVVHITPGGPCRAPVTLRCGTITITIDCGRHEPASRQCSACRTTVVERTITTTHIGPANPEQPPAPAGYAAQPCHVCGRRLSAVLAHTGRHLLCQPTTAARGRAA